MECKYFETCNAPICPNDLESVENGIWFPDEEVCKLKVIPSWVKKQRRIQKKGIPFEAGYFTVDMLNVLSSVRNGLQGINSNLPEKEAEKAIKNWLNKHSKRSKNNKVNHKKTA